MKPEDIARKYRNLHSGYRLIGYAEAGLPLTELSLTAYTIEHKPLSPVLEFTLKAIQAGLDNIDEVSSFLGFGKSFMTGVLSELIRTEDISLSGDGGDVRHRLKLTSKGTAILAKAELESPAEHTITIEFDRIQGKPIVLYGERRFYPREIREYGWLEIPAIPARRITLDDIDLAETQKAIDQMGRSLKAPKRVLLSIRDVGKQVNKFRHAVVLRYQNDQSDDRLSFTIDGIIKPDLEVAFAANDDIRKIVLESFEQLLDRETAAEIEELQKSAPGNELVAKLEEEEQIAHEKVSDAEIKLASSQSDQERVNAQSELSEAEAALDSAREKLRTAARVRNLSVYDHPAILEDALKASKSRLLIISPWIRKKVVNEGFIKNIEVLLRSGVEVFIGYGIGDDKFDSAPVRKLEELASRFPNFTFREFGDTHAKVLLSDDRYLIVGSFNWLSFKGDPASTFRDEQSVLVSVPELIEEKFQEQLERFRPQSNI